MASWGEGVDPVEAYQNGYNDRADEEKRGVALSLVELNLNAILDKIVVEPEPEPAESNYCNYCSGNCKGTDDCSFPENCRAGNETT